MSKKDKKQEQEVKEISIELLEGYLAKAEGKIDQLEEVITKYKNAEVKLRDKVAISCFSQHFTSTPSYERAAEDSYKAADAFMRVRDHGKSYEMEVIEDIKLFVANIPNDIELGKKVRELYK